MFSLLLRTLGWISLLFFAGEFVTKQYISWSWLGVVIIFMLLSYIFSGKKK